MKKNATTPTPHDAMFKQFLNNPETAREFMQLHLPSTLLALCDLSTLKLESGSFVEDDLRAYYSDVLYSLKTATGEGYIHVLIEHQSSPDKHMAFRLIRYAIAAMQRHLDAGRNKLPLVIPVLFYMGRRRPYPYASNWLLGFDDPTVAERLYCGDFPLVDVSMIPDDEIMHHRSMAALTLIQKHIFQRDLANVTDKLVNILLAGHMTRQQVTSLINYMIQAGDSLDAESFVYDLARQVPQHGDELMTIAQQLEQKGVEKGFKQGIEKGIEKGIQLGEHRGAEKGGREATLKIAQAMLQNGLDQAAILKMTDLTEKDLAHLHH